METASHSRLGLFGSGSTRTAANRLQPSFNPSVLLPISQGCRAHRTKATELLNFNMVGSGGLQCGIQRLSLYQLLPLLGPPRLTLLAGWVAGLLRRQGLFIGVELLLSPDVDLVLRRSGKHVIQF